MTNPPTELGEADPGSANYDGRPPELCSLNVARAIPGGVERLRRWCLAKQAQNEATMIAHFKKLKTP